MENNDTVQSRILINALEKHYWYYAGMWDARTKKWPQMHFSTDLKHIINIPC